MEKIKNINSLWQVGETEFLSEQQHHKETIFTLGNGYLSTRGTFEESYPQDRQATLIHGMWDDAPIVFTELANGPDWTSLTIWVNENKFQISQGKFYEYTRYLDLKSGILHRNLKWTPDNGKTILGFEFERFASLSDQHVLAVQVKITPISGPCNLRIRASLNGQVENNGYLHWKIEHQGLNKNLVDLVLSTRHTSKVLGISTQLLVNGLEGRQNYVDCHGCPSTELHIAADKGVTYILQKIVGIATSHDTDTPLDFAREKVRLASSGGYRKLRVENAVAWEQFWEISDVIIEGDDEAQLAIRHALFQLRIAAPMLNERVSIGAKTLSGFGYRGHVFWDTEIFILPFFTLTQPEVSRNLLMYRYHTLPGARRKAKKNGYSGAQYSWESAETGDEVTPTWVPDLADPLQLIRIWTGDIEVHISCDIAYAFLQYWQVTGDDDFWAEIGIPILLETAVFWGERVEQENERFSIRDVIGPDEYHEHVDNNAFTNAMVKWHLDTAISMLSWMQTNFPQKAADLIKKLDLHPKRINHWSTICEKLIILQDQETGLFEQFEGFFKLKDLNLSSFSDRKKSFQEILGIERTNQYQVLKQADVIMLLCLLRDEFDIKTWQANWNYYNPRTDHSYGSSLGPAFQAWAACELNQPDLAYEHFIRSARADLFNVRGNAGDGIHAASAGGLWQAIVFGFSGLKFKDGAPIIDPHLPKNWKRISYKIKYHGSTYHIDIRPENATIKA